MGLFDLLFGSNDVKKDKRYLQDQEMANMHEQGWDEPEDTKYDNEKLRQEKLSNYEYSNEEDEL